MSDIPIDRYNATTSSNATSHQGSSSWGSGSGSGYSTTSRARTVRRPRSPTPQLPSCLLSSAQSGSSDPDFGRGWSSGSLFEDEEEDEIDEEKEFSVMRERASDSSGGSGDKMSDEDKERLTTVQRGENRNLEDWFKELNHQVRENNGTMGEFWVNEMNTPYALHSFRSSASSSQKDNYSDGNGSSKGHPIHHQFYNPHQQHSHRISKQRFKTNGNQGDSFQSEFSANNTTDNTSGSTTTGDATQSAVGDHQRKFARRSSGGNVKTGGANGSSEGDDFRDIVDDLTVKNHKLRERLKKLESMYGSHRQKDSSKLFEVRYYHLPREKRRELEDLLRTFTVHLQHSKEGSIPSESSNSASSRSASFDRDAESTPILPAVRKATINRIIQEQTKPSSPSPAMTLLPNTPSNLLKQDVVSTLERTFTALPTDHMLKVMMSSATDGWIFLNVLVSMVNDVSDLGVPFDYLQHCIRTGSQLLELSPDGQKARLRKNTNIDNHSLNQTEYFHVNGYTKALQPHHQNGNDGEGLSKLSEHFSGNNDTDMQQPQAQDAPTSNDRITSQHAHSSPNSISSGHTASTSSSSYFQPYTPLFSRGTTGDSSSSSLTSLYSSSSSSSSDGEKRKRLETAPVIYVEGGTYCLDLSKDVAVENGGFGLGADDVPKYDRVTDVALGDVVRLGPKGPPKNKCFNCGSIEHSLQNCLQPRDTNRIRVNLEKFRGKNPSVFRGRFHTEAIKSTRFKPGVLSFELRKALGLIDSNDSGPKEGPDFLSERLPEYYYNMRIYGYPPGYLGYIEGDDPLNFPKQKTAKVTFDAELKTADDEHTEEVDFIKIGKSNNNGSVKEAEAQGSSKLGTTKKRKVEDMDENEHVNTDQEMRRKIAKVIQQHKDGKQRNVRLVKYPGMDWDMPLHDFAARVYGCEAGTSCGASLNFREGNNGDFSFSVQDQLWSQGQQLQTDYNYNYVQYNSDPHQDQQQQYIYTHGQYDQYATAAVVQWQTANYAYATSTLPPHSSLQPHPPLPSSMYAPPPPLTPPPPPPPPPSRAPSSLIPPGEGTTKLQNTARDIFDDCDDDMDISDSESQGQPDSYTKLVSSTSPFDAITESIGGPGTHTDSSNTTGSNSSQQSSDSDSQASGLPVHSATIKEPAFGFATRRLEAREHERRAKLSESVPVKPETERSQDVWDFKNEVPDEDGT